MHKRLATGQTVELIDQARLPMLQSRRPHFCHATEQAAHESLVVVVETDVSWSPRKTSRSVTKHSAAQHRQAQQHITKHSK